MADKSIEATKQSIEKYQPYFKSATKADGSAGGWWSVSPEQKNYLAQQQKAWLRESHPGAWPWDHHGYFTMSRLAKDSRVADRLHMWAGVLLVGVAAGVYHICLKDWKYTKNE